MKGRGAIDSSRAAQLTPVARLAAAERSERATAPPARQGTTLLRAADTAMGQLHNIPGILTSKFQVVSERGNVEVCDGRHESEREGKKMKWMKNERPRQQVKRRRN